VPSSVASVRIGYFGAARWQMLDYLRVSLPPHTIGPNYVSGGI